MDFFANLKSLLNFKNEKEVASFFGVTSAAWGMFKKRNSIGTIAQKVIETAPHISLDACVATSCPQLYQLAKQSVDAAVATDSTAELESILRKFYAVKNIQRTIEPVLFSPKELPIFQKIFSESNHNKTDILERLKQLQGSCKDGTLLRDKLGDDFGFDERVWGAAIADMPAVIAAIEDVDL